MQRDERAEPTSNTKLLLLLLLLMILEYPDSKTFDKGLRLRHQARHIQKPRAGLVIIDILLIG